MVKKEKTNVEKMSAALDNIRKVVNKFNDTLDCIYVDDLFCDMIEEMKKGTEEKLTKKQRKEKVLKIMNEKFPNIIKIFEGVDILAEGIEYKVDETMKRLGDVEDSINEIEEMQEEIERKKAEIEGY